jgi:hypothetical protein
MASKSVPILPIEITRMIIANALPPSTSLFNPALTLGPNSPWSRVLRFKKAVPLVCKDWFDVGNEHLYREIVIRRPGQITVLLSTIQSSPDFTETWLPK